MLRLKKSLGQNFLSDRNVINKISSLENLKNQIIIEIGPGSGNLTKSIIQKGPNKIILDDTGDGQGVVPYLPLNEIRKNKVNN